MELAYLPPAASPRSVMLRASVQVGDRSQNDRRIARGLRRGDPAGLDAAYNAYGDTVLAYLVSTIGDRSAAEDVRQQVFLELWQRREQYEPARAGLFTWVMTIARSRRIDYLRKRIPRPHDPAVVSQLAESADEGGELDDLVERWRVAQLLRRIPAQEAELLRMRFHDELTQPEIAERTGIPLGTVKMRMVQALERLREMIDGGEES